MRFLRRTRLTEGTTKTARKVVNFERRGYLVNCAELQEILTRIAALSSEAEAIGKEYGSLLPTNPKREALAIQYREIDEALSPLKDRERAIKKGLVAELLMCLRNAAKKRLRLHDLPENLYLLGDWSSDAPTCPFTVFKEGQGRCVLLAWSKRESRSLWMAARGIKYSVFETDRITFVTLAFCLKQEQAAFLLLDLTPEDPVIGTQGLVVENFPRRCLVDLRSPELLSDFFHSYSGTRGLRAETIAHLLDQFQIVKDFAPVEFIDNNVDHLLRLRLDVPVKVLKSTVQFEETWCLLESQLRLANPDEALISLTKCVAEAQPDLPLSNAQAQAARIEETSFADLELAGILEYAWLYFEVRFRQTGGSDNIALIRRISEVHPELSLAKATKLASGFMQVPISELKADGYLEFVWKILVRQILSDHNDPVFIESCRKLVWEHDDLKLNTACTFLTHAQTMQFPDFILLKTPDGFALKGGSSEMIQAYRTCPPPSTCGACGEKEWEFLTLSPSGSAATWKCEYCGRKTIVRADMVAARNSAGNRQPIPKDIQTAVWQRDEGRCVECGSREFLEFDHIIPIAKGGANTARNLQLLCERCNRSKGSKDPGSY